MTQLLRAALLTSLVLASAGCRTAYYETLELFGTHKRDILVERVSRARSAQQGAQEHIVDTLAAFQELVGAGDEPLGRLYERLRRRLVRAEDRAAQVHRRIDAIETVAQDLFTEWRSELDTISNPALRLQSEVLLEDTRDSYALLLRKMRAAAEGMEPVLVAFRDQVTFLKHSLNAQAVDALRGTREQVEADVGELVHEMQAAIEEAERFIQEMRRGADAQADA